MAVVPEGVVAVGEVSVEVRSPEELKSVVEGSNVVVIVAVVVIGGGCVVCSAAVVVT